MALPDPIAAAEIQLSKQPSVILPGSASPAPKNSQVAAYSPIQMLHVGRLEPVKYCVNPEWYLEEASTQYLPKELYECNEAYEVRISRSYSTFQPFYKHLRNLIVGTALRRPIQLGENVAKDWQSFFDNADLEGKPLQSFVKTIFTEAIDGGWCGIFVEYPEVPPGLTRAQELALKLRPYFLAIPAQDVLGWTTELSQETLGDNTVYGRKLTSLRIKDVHREPGENEFEENVLPAVRVYDYALDLDNGIEKAVRCRKFVLRKTNGTQQEEYVQETSAFLSAKVIPFVPIYGGTQEDYLSSRPLLLDIARLNLHHWVVSADLANQLHLTCNPKFVVSGVTGGAADFDNSSDRTLVLERPEAKAEWIGAPMAGAEVAQAHLANIEASMETLAAVAMTNKATDQAESGFSKLLDRAQSDSILAVLVQGLEDGVNRALEIAAEYWSASVNKITISRDFVPIRLHSQQILAYVELYNNKVICHETLLKILNVGDIFDGIADFDIAQELQRIGSSAGDTGVNVAQELAKATAKARSAFGTSSSGLNGVRPRQAKEAGQQVKEAARPVRAG